jgi:hypothetical protein
MEFGKEGGGDAQEEPNFSLDHQVDCQEFAVEVRRKKRSGNLWVEIRNRKASRKNSYFFFKSKITASMSVTPVQLFMHDGDASNRDDICCFCFGSDKNGAYYYVIKFEVS